MSDAYRLDGKVAIVTGGAGGIGSVTCTLLAERGAQVVVADLDGDRAAAIAGADSLALDLSDETTIAGSVTEVAARHGSIDILVNNAAMLDPNLALKDASVEMMDIAVRTAALPSTRAARC